MLLINSSKKPPRNQLDFHPKRGKSVNHNAMHSNGFARSVINNSTSYQSNFNDIAFSTSTSKNFAQSPLTTIENRKSTKRADSLIARSATYSNVPCPHWDRKFSTAAAERHIPICRSIIAKPSALRSSTNKRSSVQLPHLSNTTYNNGGFDHNLMNNTSSTFRSSRTKFPKENKLTKTQSSGLPPTYKGSAGSNKMKKIKTNDFAMKRWFWGSWGSKFGSKDKFWSMWGDKRVI